MTQELAPSQVKQSIIVTTASAESTGLIPQGMTVRVRFRIHQDFPEDDVDLATLDYSTCTVQDGERSIWGGTMMIRTREVKAIGSLGLAAELLKAQDEGMEIFPVESRGKHRFIMPLTELRDDMGDDHVGSFRWNGNRWVLDFVSLSFRFFSNERFVRRSE